MEKNLKRTTGFELYNEKTLICVAKTKNEADFLAQGLFRDYDYTNACITTS